MEASQDVSRSSHTSAGEGALAQCRFCLEEAPIEELLAPCRCEGTSRFVHVACLRRWQRQVASDLRSAVCSVCRSSFSLLPAAEASFEQLAVADDPEPSAFDEENWPVMSPRRLPPIFDSVRASSRYRPFESTHLPGHLRESVGHFLGAGCILLQTPHLAAARRPEPPEERNDDSDMPVFGAALATRLSHFHKGIFLLAAVWPGKAADGSDALVGVNLGGAMRTVDGMQNLHELKVRLKGAPLSASLGGPVKPGRALCLVAFRGIVSPEGMSRFVQLVRPLDSSEDEVAVDVDVWGTIFASPGGDVTSRALLGASSLRRGGGGGGGGWGDPLNSDPAVDGALFGEPQHVAEALTLQPQLRPLAARVFNGHAVWSSSQLLCEIIGGTWGVTRSTADDLSRGCRAQDASSSWSSFRRSHEVVEFTEARFDAPIPAAAPCSASRLDFSGESLVTEEDAPRSPSCLSLRGLSFAMPQEATADTLGSSPRRQSQPVCGDDPGCAIA